MHTQIIKVNDIDKAIQDVGIQYYVDRLLQDEFGDYCWVETTYEPPFTIFGWKTQEVGVEECSSGSDTLTEKPVIVYYRIVKIPKELAWFCIDALKLQSQVMGIGSGSYEDDSLHGGNVKYYVIDSDGAGPTAKEVKRDVVRIEQL